MGTQRGQLDVIIRGGMAEIRYGYQVAATLGTWEASPKIVPEPDQMVFKAVIRTADDYWLGQEPLQLAATLGRSRWIWANVTVTIADEGRTLHAELKGKPVVEPL